MRKINEEEALKEMSNKYSEDLDYDSESERELYIDTSDEEHLKSMSEKERYKILYERHAKLMAYKERKEIDRKLVELEKLKSGVLPSEKSTKTDLTLERFSAWVFTRDELLKNAHKPVFEKFIGHFVKVKIRDTYYIVKVENIGFCENYSVKLGRVEVQTNRNLDLNSGDDIFKKINIQFLSNSSVDEEDLSRFNSRAFHIDAKRHESEVKSLKKLVKKDLESASVSKEGRKQKFLSTRKKNILLKIELIKKRERALEMRKYDQAEDLQKQIDVLTAHEKGEEDIWAAISERNRKINAHAARVHSGNFSSEGGVEDDRLNPCKRKRSRSSYE